MKSIPYKIIVNELINGLVKLNDERLESAYGPLYKPPKSKSPAATGLDNNPQYWRIDEPNYNG